MQRSFPALASQNLVALMGMMLLLWSAGSLPAQIPVSSPSPEDRAKAYRELADEVDALERVFGLLKKVVRISKPTVVHIEAAKSRQLNLGFGQRGIEEAGSGVIINLSGEHYVLTNRHVIKNAEQNDIKIKLVDGREIRPLRIWSDQESDVAVMRIEAEHLIPAKIGDSSSVEIGDFVIAVGSPFGLSHSTTFGIISAKGRRDLELGEERVRLQDFMQTDAAINPGNSGGPLMNLRGELIGINTAIASSSGGSEGIGFTIPVNMAMMIAKQLITNGEVTRAFLGVNLDSQFRPAIATRLGLGRPQGAHITGITPDSPAQAAQLQVDDVILRFGEVDVQDDNHLVNLVGLTEVGREVPILVLRDRKPVKLKVRVGDRSEFNRPK